MSECGFQILIVHDDPTVLALMVEQLTRRGCDNVVTAKDSVGALSTVRDRALDVVVANCTLPGLDGFQLCRLLHSPLYSNAAGSPQVILTGNGHYDMVAAEIARSVQAFAYVQPASDVDQLYNVIVDAANSREQFPDLTVTRSLGHALLITNDAECAAAMEEILSTRGWELHFVNDGPAAQRIAERENVELTFFDCGSTPNGWEERLREFKTNHPDAMIVAITADERATSLLSLMQAGADDFLMQPLDPNAVNIVCLNALNRHSLLRIHRQFQDKIEELRAMSDYLDMVIRYSQEAIFSCDTVGHVKIWNKGAERMYGYTAEEITGGIVDDYLDPPDFTRKSPDVVRILQQRGWSFVESEILRRKKTGEVFPVHATYSAIINAEGECIGFSVIERDVGTHKALEAEKIKSARLRAITQTAVTANDQINTPLGVILGYAQFLQRKMVNIAPEDVAALEIIQQQVLKIKGIMNKLKLMSDPIVKNYSIEGVTMLDLTQSK